MKLNNETDVFVDYDAKLFQHLINQLRKNSFKRIYSPNSSLNDEKSFKTMLIDLSISRKLNTIFIRIAF